MSRRNFHGKPCPYCRRQMNLSDFHLKPTWDHVVPKSRGGKEKVVCCHKCNGIKGDMMPNDWREYMHANPGWWLLTRAERRQRNREARRKYGQLNVHGNIISFRRERQGSPPPAPVIVPPELIYGCQISAG